MAGVGAGGAAGASAAAAAAVAQAIKASGAIIRVDPESFQSILNRSEAPLVVIARGGWFSARYQYMTSYKGLIFYCKSDEELHLPEGVELIESKSIWIPG